MITINIDGASRGNPGPAGYGVVAIDKNGNVLVEAYGYIGKQTNNFAEYCALIAALELALKKGWKKVKVKSDSQLLVRQLSGEYKVKDKTLAIFYRRARKLISGFESISVNHVVRSENKAADKLANKGVDEQSSHPKGINPILIRQRDQ